MMRRPTTLTLALLLAAALPALAQGPGGGGPPQGTGGQGGQPNPIIGMAGMALHQVELTSDQQTEIHGLVRRHTNRRCRWLYNRSRR